MASPYENLPSTAFWKAGVTGTAPEWMKGIYKKKWSLSGDLNVATAGSCFAQHISRYLRKNGFVVMDVEPAPSDMNELERQQNGYGLYSARYGNIYTVQQLLQLAREVAGEFAPVDAVWERDGRYYDALRPSIPEQGYESVDACVASRRVHLSRVKELFQSADVFIFTLGLTEAWVHKGSGTVFPTAPETIAGKFSDQVYEFKNFSFLEIYAAFEEFANVVKRLRGSGPELKVMLTVSPVPLTATASGRHILQASTYSKSVLRAVAGQLSQERENVDYFPSFEIITNPASKSKFYRENLRTVTDDGVSAVMRVFFNEHSNGASTDNSAGESMPDSTPSATRHDEDALQCEEALLDAFSAQRPAKISGAPRKIVFIGDSHLSGAKSCVEKYFSHLQNDYEIFFIPTTWLKFPLVDMAGHQYLTSLQIRPEYQHLIPRVPTPEEMRSNVDVCIVGVGMLGDGIVRAYGDLKAGTPDASDGKSFSPSLPVIRYSHELASHEVLDLEAVEGYADVRRMYVHALNLRINICTELLNSGIYRSVRWIASPNMVERSARYRFGSDYVDSKSHLIHARIAESYLEKYVAGAKPNGWLIKHSQAFQAQTGFTYDEFAYSENLNDIHASPEFYKPAISAYLQSI